MSQIFLKEEILMKNENKQSYDSYKLQFKFKKPKPYLHFLSDLFVKLPLFDGTKQNLTINLLLLIKKKFIKNFIYYFYTKYLKKSNIVCSSDIKIIWLLYLSLIEAQLFLLQIQYFKP